MAVIQAQDLYKCYAGFAPVLRGASIEVEAGEMAAIMGPSGCGKSTMLHILGMLHRPDSGSLNILNTDVLKLDNEQTAAFRRGNMGFVMQASNLFEHSTVFENVEFPLIYENVPPQERWARVIRALELVGLSGRVHYRSNRLSGGEQQRVAIARAMVNNPRILLADEPTGALDARTSVLIMENFRNLCHEGGVAMIMVTHDPKMADYCDSIYTLEDGKLVCKKHKTPDFKAKSGQTLLNPPEPLVRGSFVSLHFPGAWQWHLPLLTRRLHESRLLSKIYQLKGKISGAEPKGYALPLPIRQANIFQRIKAGLSLLFHSRASHNFQESLKFFAVQSMNNIPKKLSSLASSYILSTWVKEDNIEFIYAADANVSANAAWISANEYGKPFAFSVNPEDINVPTPALEKKCQAAAFITCETDSLKKAILSKFPSLPQEKVIVVRPQLSFQPEEEISAEPGQPLSILGTGVNFSKKGWETLADAASILEREKFAFQLGILDYATREQKSYIHKKKLGNILKFYGLPGSDSVAEIYRTSNIFIACKPDWPGGEYYLPLPLCEAMACGLTIIALDSSPALNEVLKENENCIVLNAENPELLAETIKTLAKETEKRKTLGANAKNCIIPFLNIEETSRLLTDRIVMAAALADRNNKHDI